MAYRIISSALLTAVCAIFCARSSPAADPAPARKSAAPLQPLLVFLEPDDARDPVGLLSFQANPLKLLGSIDTPTHSPENRLRLAPPSRTLLSLPQPDGSRLIFGCTHQPATPDGKTYQWTIYRGRTPDGYRLTEIEEVYRNPTGPWLIESSMARQGRDGPLFFFTWSRGVPAELGHALWVFSSEDGRDWKPLSEKPVYHDHDAFGLMWDMRTNRFLTCQVTHQAWRKPFSDNLGQDQRRVLSIRTSPDGLNWQKHTDTGQEGLVVPDAQDPPELEFYRMQPFHYADRYIAMADLYAASPLTPARHGPHLGCEWWVSSDAIRWRRPWRTLNAQGEAPYPVKMEPMWFDGHMLFWIEDAVWGLPEFRIASIGARANAAFSTRPFKMPGTPLLLNASIPAGAGLFRQAYVRAELRDAAGQTIPGYEREHCLLQNADDTRIPLRWNGRDATERAGEEVSLRLYFRDARIYGLACQGPDPAQDQ